MLTLLWIVVALPIAGFLWLALFGARLSRRSIMSIGVGAVGLALLSALHIAYTFFTSPPKGGVFVQTLWTWMHVESTHTFRRGTSLVFERGSFHPEIAFYLDPLSLLMVLVVLGVGFLIFLFSAWYMAEDTDLARFYAYMNLFVASMLILVLADNLLLLYLGWEGVGLCSYLLIGFWYQDPANVRAAMKAFLITRIGDTAFIIGLFLLFTQLGTLQIQEVLTRAGLQWAPGSALAVTAAALLLGGALGKSAQLPLQTWLPDAMAGPTPVSALIHAATMVTAGVYLIARTHTLFSLAPSVMLIVAIIGAVTLLVGGVSALVQRDIKRVLAYSTMSQIGYMFLALGIGAWSAAMFHFMTHAFFKALLFLAAGVVIHSLHNEQDIFNMGGLRKQLPLAFWSFLIGALSLAALPLVTAGFYSKDEILHLCWASALGSPWLYAAALVGAFLTAFYIFRVFFLVFGGASKREVAGHLNPAATIPLVVLAVLSIVGGLVQLPRVLGGVPLFSNMLAPVLPAITLVEDSPGLEWVLLFVSAIVSLVGIGMAYLLYARRTSPAPARDNVPARFFRDGWGFDWLYDQLFVRPYCWIVIESRHDVFDALYAGIAELAEVCYHALRRTQTGKVRWYAAVLVFGVVLILAMVVFR